MAGESRRRRAARPGDGRNEPGRTHRLGERRGPLAAASSPAGATAQAAIRKLGRDAFFEKTFSLMESADPAERAVAEMMLRGAWEALS
jgi:hypothetical protein